MSGGSAAEPSVPVDDDAEEGEILDDEEEEAETATHDKQQQSHSTTHKSETSSSKSTSSDKHKKPGSKSSRSSKSSGSGRKRHRDDEVGTEAKKSRDDSDHESDDSIDSGADDEATKQRLIMQMMQIMLQASKKGRKSDRKTMELMDKMLKPGSDFSAKEAKEIVRKNRRLLRSGSRDRRSRSRSRDRRTRSRRTDSRRDRSSSRDPDAGKFNRSPDRIIASGPMVDPRTGVGLLKEKCKFFAEGKCLKGFDCPYSHEIILNKKREICKFYLQGYCGKGEHCFFMHEEFPCKFFHTGADCYSGDKCRFSHQPLTEEGRSILRGYLDSGELPDDHLRNRQSEVLPETDNGSVPAVAALPAATSAAPTAATATYQPVKPVPKRHAILGDVTDAMRTNYYTWSWQQELKELENAYQGNKRNLFCVDKQFIVNEKPATPPPEDPDEEEFKVFSFYTDTMGDVDIRQMPPPIHGMNNDVDIRVLPPVQVPNEDDLFLMSAAHDEDLRIPPPQRLEALPVHDTLQSGVATDNTMVSIDRDPLPPPDPVHLTDQPANNVQKVRDVSGGGDSPSGQSESKAKPKYDIAKMLNVIRQSTSQSATAAAPASGHSEFWQNIFSGTSLAASPSNSTTQMSPSQVKDPRLKKETARPEETASALVKQNSSEALPEDEDSEFRLMAVTVPRIDYSTYVSLFHNDIKLKNDPRLQKFFTRSPSADQLTQFLPPDSSSKSFTSSTITQTTLMSLMSSSGNNHPLSSGSQYVQDRDDRLTPTSPPHLPSLPPLTLNQVPKTAIMSIVPPPPPAMTPLELISSKPCPPLDSRPVTRAPPPLSFHSAALQKHEVSANHENENGSASAMDLSAKRSPEARHGASDDVASPPAVVDDTPASPSSRRSSCDTILSPPLIQAAAMSEEASNDGTDDAAAQDLKSVFAANDPAASPFC